MAKKYFQNPNLRDVRDGERFVIDSSFKYSHGGDHGNDPRRVVTLRTSKRMDEIPLYAGGKELDDGPYAVDAAGRTFEIYARHGSFSIRERTEDGVRDRHACWTLPVPDLSDEEVLAYVDAFMGSGENFSGRLHRDDHSAPNCVFVIDSLTDRHGLGRMVSFASDTQDEYLAYLDEKSTNPDAFPKDYTFHFVENLDGFRDAFVVQGALAISSFEVRIPRVQLPEAATVGSLIVGSSFWVNEVKGQQVTSVANAGIAGNVRSRSLDTYLPFRTLDRPSMIRRMHSGPELATIQDWLKEAARAKAKLDPDEILLAVLPKDKNCSPYSSTHIIAFGSRGAVFFEDQSTWEETIAADDPDPGLWMFRNASPWSHRSYEGEYDGGIEGEWHPATIEDLVFFGNDLEEVSRELAEIYEGEDFASAVESGSFLEELMRLSRQTSQPAAIASAP